MASLGIIPAPEGAYVELAGTGQGRLFRKHILTVNRQFVHPKTGEPLTLGEDAWRQMKANFDGRRVTDIVAFPLANDRNQHVENPLSNAGLVTALEREGDRVFATIDVRDPDVAQRIEDGRLPGASAMLHLNARDPRTGEKAGAALLHVCGTLRPALVDLAPYEPVVAATGEAFEELPDGSVLPPRVLMLCASEVDPPVLLADPDTEPDYPAPDYGGPAMDYDYLRDESARLGLEAMHVSSGRESRLSYDHVAAQREHEDRCGKPRPEFTEDDCLRKALELTAQTGAGFTQIMTAARQEVAGEGEPLSRDWDAVYREMAGTAQRVGLSTAADPAALALTAQDEADRVWAGYSGDAAAEGEIARLTGQTHPRKSGVRVTSKTRSHSSDLEDYEDPRDHAQPAKGGQIHPEVARILREHGLELGISSNESHPPKGPGRREQDEHAARDSHKLGMRDLHGSARERRGF